MKRYLVKKSSGERYVARVDWNTNDIDIEEGIDNARLFNDANTAHRVAWILANRGIIGFHAYEIEINDYDMKML